MSRLANKAIAIPKGVTVNVLPNQIEIKGSKKTVYLPLPTHIEVIAENEQVKLGVTLKDITENKRTKLLKLKKKLNVLIGTMWALIKNNMTGVSEGFKVKLELVGVGYRAQAQGKKLNLTLGFSHPVVYEMPEGVTVETPSQTEVVLISSDKQLIFQVAAKIRAYRPPECYKGKGIKFAGEVIPLKETKKK